MIAGKTMITSIFILLTLMSVISDRIGLSQVNMTQLLSPQFRGYGGWINRRNTIEIATSKRIRAFSPPDKHVSKKLNFDRNGVLRYKLKLWEFAARVGDYDSVILSGWLNYRYYLIFDIGGKYKPYKL